MAETLIDRIVEKLRATLSEYYPRNGSLRNIRQVGHTPKTDHFVYDIVAEFDGATERLAVKVYRPGKNNGERVRDQIQVMDAVYGQFDGHPLSGLARPLGDFSDFSAVVTEKPSGLPLQSIIMKAALLPAYSELALVSETARACGAWLRTFHGRTSLPAQRFDARILLAELETVCANCKGSGLDDGAIHLIVNGSTNSLQNAATSLPCSVVLNDFTPLNIAVGEHGIGVYDYSRMVQRGSSLDDVASFMASVEALEKYPFCNRNLVVAVQDAFCAGYELPRPHEGVVRVLRMKFLLGMFAQGRNVKETALRKKIMWANVMKRFIHHAAERSMTAA